jgi:hypothetical protein
MGNRRRWTLGERGAQPDQIRHIVYGLPEAARQGSRILGSWLGSKPRGRRHQRCTCGTELPLTGQCDYCD